MKLLDRLSTCPDCGHRVAEPDCSCGKEDGGAR